MKRHILILLLALLATSVSAFAQKYSATFNNATPTETVEILRKATGHDFVYQKSLLQENKLKVNGHFNEMSLSDLLDRTIVNQLNMSYKVTGNTITLNKAVVKDAPQGEVSGIIVDEMGEPLPGATVMIKGGNGQGTATDLNGHFSLKVNEPVNELRITYVGMKPLTIKAKAGSVIPIRMESAVGNLDEMVVTGYQNISKERAAGSFTKIEAKDLKSQTITSVDDMLEGHVAGYTDGRIRGITSMQGITSPLYVIDGFPIESTRVGYAGGSFSEYTPNVNVDDIESITVLKDAAATSIYGARAANGVVVITTKKAKAGKLNVSASATFSANPYKRVDTYRQDSKETIAEVRDWISQNPNFIGDGAVNYAQNMLKVSSNLSPHMKAIYQRYAGLISESQLNSMLDKWAAMGYNYYDEADKLQYRTATNQRYNLSVTSSTDRNSIVGSIAYNRSDFHLKDSWSQDLDISLRNTIKMTRWLDLDLGASVIYSSNSNPTYSLYNPGFTTAPYMSLYNEDGSKFVSKQEDRLDKSRLDAINKYGLYNEDIDPFDDMGRSTTSGSDLVTRLNARMIFSITDWLKFTTQFQYEFDYFQDKTYQDSNTYEVRNYINNFASSADGVNPTYNLPYGDIYHHNINDQRAYNFRNQLDFNKTFADVHQVTAIAGFEMRHNKTRYESNTYYGYDEQMLTWTTVDQNAIQSFANAIFGRPWISASDFASFRELTNRFISFYANAAYSYDDKYIVNGSIRTDRTNLYGTSSKYQGKPIWSVGAAWRIDREKFMQSVSWVNMIKLRASYGIGGNIAKNQWPYTVANYGTNTSPGVGGVSGNISSRPNPKLRWEKTTTVNVGVDFDLLNSKLNGSIEFYNKKGVDLLASSNGVSVEGQGFSTNTINNGEMTNRGVEIQLTGTPIRTRDWTWNIQAIYGYNHSNVDFVNIEAPVYFLQLDYPESFPRVGVPFTAMYGYKWAGLSEDGIPQVYDANGEIWSSMTPTNLEDIIYLGSYTPTYSGSLSTNLRYRNFVLSALALFEGGHKMRCTNFTYNDRWHQPGDEAKTDVPRYVSYENPDYYVDSSIYTRSSAVIKDASNWRIRNIALTYNLPQMICKKFFANEASVKFAVENVATFAKSKAVKYALNGYNHPNYVVSLYLNF